MKAILCEECLTRRGVFSVCLGPEACRHCGHVPVVALTRREIRACIGARP